MLISRIGLGVCVVLGCLVTLNAQIKFDVKVSDKHLKKVENSKDARSKLSTYKTYYAKDSLKAAKAAWKQYKLENKDSLKAAGTWKEAKRHQKEVLLGKWGVSEKYFVDPSTFGQPKDSLDWALQEFSRHGDYEKVQEYYESYGAYDSAFLDHFKKDSMLLSDSELSNRFAIKKRMKSYLPPELAAESDKKLEDQLLYNELDGYGNLRKVDRSGVKEFFQNVDKEEFSKSQAAILLAKKKYSSVPSLDKKEEGIKRNSLKGSPLKKRLFLNGNVSVQSTSPFIMDVNIQLGYQWTKKLSSGVGILWREQFGGQPNTSPLTGDAHGYSFFTNYDILQGFFLYGEYQAVINKPLFGESSQASSWQYAALLGAGRKFQLGKKISLSVSLLYDFNYKNNELNQRPLVPRLGYSMRF